MADMPSGFWSGWIVVVTLVSLLALVWLVVTVYFPSRKTSKALQDSPTLSGMKI